MPTFKYIHIMRVVGEIQHPFCKITLFNWNNKYIVKFERGQIEQTYKVNELDLTGEEDIKEMLNEQFLDKVMKRFDDMDNDWDALVGDDF
jgi:hypothetical protein